MVSIFHPPQSSFAKIVADFSTRQLIGCHLMFPGAGIFLPWLMTAMRKKWTVGDLVSFSSNLGTSFQIVAESARMASKAIKSTK